jgi:hypothetical protein
VEAGDLFGMRVVATSLGGRTLRLTGVLLPPDRPGGLPRLHADQGGVQPINPDRWRFDAEGDRRRCGDGRPVYEHGDVPVQLATMSMLARTRRRPAPGQEPVATYWGGRAYRPLYAVADADRLAPLPPSKQARWERNRTCGRCGAFRELAWKRGVDGRRYCDRCLEPAAEEWWHTRRADGRRRAAEWAAGVAADPSVVLVYAPSRAVRAETLRGRVLVDALCDEQPSAAGRYTVPRDVAGQVAALARRRIVVAWWDLHELQKVMTRGGVHVELPLADRFGPHWDEWRGERDVPRRGEAPYRLHHTLVRQQLPGDPAGHIAAMRAGIVEMAGGWEGDQ